MINKTAILVCSLAVVVAVIIAGIMINFAYQNCERFEDEIKNHPDGLIAQDCKRWGFKINQTDSNLP